MVDPDKPNNNLLKLPPVGVNLETVDNLKLCIQASRALSLYGANFNHFPQLR